MDALRTAVMIVGATITCLLMTLADLLITAIGAFTIALSCGVKEAGEYVKVSWRDVIVELWKKYKSIFCKGDEED